MNFVRRLDLRRTGLTAEELQAAAAPALQEDRAPRR